MDSRKPTDGEIDPLHPAGVTRGLHLCGDLLDDGVNDRKLMHEKMFRVTRESREGGQEARPNGP